MFIKEVKIINFKSFGADTTPITFKTPNGESGSGLNIFVGENNTGKSSAFEAIDFVRNGTKKSIEDIKNKSIPNEAIVEVTFVGNISKVIESFSQENKISKFKEYIYKDSDDNEHIKISRSTSDVKSVKLWNNSSAEYKNEAGIDAPIKKLFETNFVWADTNPNDEASFGSTTICGYLLKEIVSNFTMTSEYQEFQGKFNKVFNDDNSKLKQDLKAVEDKVKKIFAEQFGNAEISFHFDELKIESFFKNVKIELNDGVNTSMSEKGNGMQRAVALALLQVYAEELVRHPEGNEIEKPFYLFIDEPEICLHPKGQTKLLSALLELSKNKQIFLTTHSPYFLATPSLKDIGVFVFNKDGQNSNVESASSNPYFPWSPTWGEINHKAYKLATVELHNELYGYLQEREQKHTEHEFNAWLVQKGINSTYSWTKEIKGVVQSPYSTTPPTFIRNSIHHPENKHNQKYTHDELEQSIQQMINLL